MAKEGKARVLNENEFKRLLVMAKDSPFALRNVAIIYCSFGLGLRVKEISALTFKDIVDQEFKAP
jgi:integrase/recombinase XerD